MNAWKALNGPISNKITKIYKSNYMASIDHNILAKYEDIKNLYNNKDYQIVDVRSFGRFAGKEEEPRPGLQKGHSQHADIVMKAQRLEKLLIRTMRDWGKLVRRETGGLDNLIDERYIVLGEYTKRIADFVINT